MCFKTRVPGGSRLEAGVGNVVLIRLFSPSLPRDQQPVCTRCCDHAEEQLRSWSCPLALVGVSRAEHNQRQY